MYKSVPRNTFYWTKCVHDLHINKAIHSDPPMWSHSIPKLWWVEPVLYFLVLPIISYVYMQTYIYIYINMHTICIHKWIYIYIYIWCKNIHDKYLHYICVCVSAIYIYSVFICMHLSVYIYNRYPNHVYTSFTLTEGQWARLGSFHFFSTRAPSGGEAASRSGRANQSAAMDSD